MANKKFAEMTGAELWTQFVMGVPATFDGIAALRDAILAERDAEWEARVKAEKGVDPAFKLESECAWAAMGEDATMAVDPTTLGSRILKLRAEVHALRTRAELAEKGRVEACGGIRAWQARADDLDARLRTAESALGEAKREYPHLIFCNSSRSQPIGPDIGCVCWNKLHRECSATPSGEGVPPAALEASTRATPQPEPLVIPVVDTFGVPRITITPALARRIVAMGQKETYL